MADAIDSKRAMSAIPYGNLLALLDYQAVHLPQSTAILAPGRQGLSYAGLRDLVRQVGASLRALGIGPDDRVAVVLPNGPEMATAFLAVASCAACAPLNPAYQAAEFRFYLQDLGARALMLLADDDSPARGVAAELGVTVIDLQVDTAQPAGHFDVPAPDSIAVASDNADIAQTDRAHPAHIGHDLASQDRAAVPRQPGVIGCEHRAFSGTGRAGPVPQRDAAVPYPRPGRRPARQSGWRRQPGLCAGLRCRPFFWLDRRVSANLVLGGTDHPPVHCRPWQRVSDKPRPATGFALSVRPRRRCRRGRCMKSRTCSRHPSSKRTA